MGKIFAVLFVMGFAAFMFVGWCLNLMAVIHTVNDPIAGTFILRIVGIFLAPLGAIFGWVI